MTSAENVPDGATWMDNAIVNYNVDLLTDGPLVDFRVSHLIVGVNSLIDIFDSGQSIAWVETEHAVAFLRPIPVAGVGTPSPAARVAEFLRLCQIRLTFPQIFFCPPLFRDVSHRAHKFAVAGCILGYVRQGMDMFDSAIGQQQTIGMLEIGGSPGRTFND